MWRLAVAAKYRFDDRLPGAALGEDVEMSARIGRDFLLRVDTSVRLPHLSESAGRADVRLWAFKSVRNRYLICLAMGRRHAKIAFWWSVLGQVLPLLLRAPFLLLGRPPQ
jgi:hypothetical protein